MKDLETKIELLEKRIAELEKDKKKNLELFGKSYTQIGSPNSDCIINTKGLVKIKYNSKTIDLIKNGKLNVNFEFLFTGSEVGDKEGIWILDNGEIWIKPKNSDAINITSSSDSFVSYLELKVTPEELLQALINVGFFCNTLDDVDLSVDKLVYVLQDQMLYVVYNGNLTPFSIPTDSKEFELSYIKYDGSVVTINDILNIEPNQTSSINPFVSNYFKSFDANHSKGFILENTSEGSRLYVDEIIERNRKDESLQIFPEFYFNSVTKMKYITEDGFLVFDRNIYKTNDVIGCYVDDIFYKIKITNSDDDDLSYEIIESKELEEELEEDDSSEDSEEKDDIIFNPKDTICFLMEREGIPIVRMNSDGILLLLNSEVIGKIGKLDNEESGLFFNLGYFKNAERTEKLAEDDNSAKFATTEWVNAKMKLVTNSDIDLYYRYETVDEFNIIRYINESGLIEAIQQRESMNLSCYHGQATIISDGITSQCSLIVSAKLEDFLSYRAIHFEVGTAYNISAISSYIIKDLFVPGYYWSVKENGGKPVSPVYIGTTYEGFSVSESKPILWYSNDGKTWEKIKVYVKKVLTRLYVISTHLSAHLENNKTSLWPSGFIGIYGPQGSTSKYGMSNFVPLRNETDPLNPNDFSLLKSLTSTATSGYIPELDGFGYLWSIDANADKAVPSNWVRESSSNSQSSIVHVVESAQWSNATNIPGYTLKYVDPVTFEIGDEAPDTIFKLGDGNETNWNDPVWRASFLRCALKELLNANKGRYSETIGWIFNQDGVLSSRGSGGLLLTRVGSALSPTSDNPNEIGYKLPGNIGTISGYAISEQAVVHFLFRSVRIGNRLPYTYVLSSYPKGTKIKPNYNIYDVEYDSYRVAITLIPINSVHRY